MIEATFYVDSMPIYGDLILAPMRGYSDLPYRSICRSMGSAMSYTPFASAIGILTRDKDTRKLLRYEQDERPVVFQICDHDVKRLLDSAREIRKLNPDIIDINMGCSTRGISGKGAGAGLLKNITKAGKIIQSLSSHLDLPVSAKIRLGWSRQNKNYVDISRSIEDHGGALIAVHSRTRDQGYGGVADWDAIAEIKATVHIPVIGNGDVKTVEDIDYMKYHTGCDAVMIGRAAQGNPWIFQRRNRSDVRLQELAAIVQQHLERMVNFYGPRWGVVRFRKHLAAYIDPLNVPPPARSALLTCSNWIQLHGMLHKIGLRPEESNPPSTISDKFSADE